MANANASPAYNNLGNSDPPAVVLARELALSGEYQQTTHMIGLETAAWLIEHSHGYMTPANRDRLSPVYLRPHLIAVPMDAMPQIYRLDNTPDPSPSHRIEGFFLRKSGFIVVGLDDGHTRWNTFDDATRQRWVRYAYNHEAVSTDLEESAIRNLETGQLQQAVNEEVTHLAQARDLTKKSMEVLARWVQYDLRQSIGILKPTAEMERCHAYVEQLAAQYGKEAILSLNYGLHDGYDTRLLKQIEQQIIDAFPTLMPEGETHYNRYV